MVLTQANRIILLLLLPVIALAVYLEGQSYDPALINFTSEDVRPAAAAGLFPRQVNGLARSGQVRVFTRDNLYEYVNGHAEYFISAGFQSLAVGEYRKEGSDSGQPEVVVDLYDMGKGIHAFGVFTEEVGDNPDAVNVGMMGAKTAQGISFINGKYYIRINTFQETAPIDALAREIDRQIGPSSEEITVFSRLPVLGETVSTRFIKEGYRGLDFANNVVEREYLVDGKNIYVSLVTGTDTEMNERVSSYLAFFNDSDTPYEEMRYKGAVVYKVSDPYEGVWYLVLRSGELFGIYGEVDGPLLDQVLMLISAQDTGT